ncbi:MAG TPA: ribosome maturation factor RimM [Methylophilaceae bacterium]|nr:ribosome maturation factor RimM [Methylophilaceae bacterium]
MIVMGRIVAPYGILGWLKILPETAEVDGLLDYPQWWIGREEGIKKQPWQSFQVEAAKVHGNTLLVKLAGIGDRSQALAMKGRHIAVPREALPPLDDDEFYHADLIDLQVINQQREDFGRIVDVIETGANDVLVVKQGERERLIPFIDQVIVEVDLAQKLIKVDWDAEF